MKPVSILTLAPITLLALFSCGERQIRGGGSEGTESRSVSAFNAVEIHGSEDVEFLPASTPRVEVSGFKNLLEHYKTTVKAGTLQLGYDDDGLDLNIRNSNLRVRVYSPGFQSIALAGSGDVVVQPGAATPVQRVELAGSGDITLRQSEVPQLVMEIAGSGNINAQGARAATVRAEIAGSGNIETSVTNQLEAEIAGSGDVHYWGAPQVSQDVAGSGDVVRH